MELELLDYSIGELGWGERTRLNGGTLSLCRAELEKQIEDLCHGIQVDFELARPGEAKRIVHVLDTVMPIAKLSGGGSTFPGFEGPGRTRGQRDRRCEFAICSLPSPAASLISTN